MEIQTTEEISDIIYQVAYGVLKDQGHRLTKIKIEWEQDPDSPYIDVKRVKRFSYTCEA